MSDVLAIGQKVWCNGAMGLPAGLYTIRKPGSGVIYACSPAFDCPTIDSDATIAIARSEMMTEEEAVRYAINIIKAFS